MGKFKIFPADGATAPKAEGNIKYVGTFLKPAYVQVDQIQSPVAITWAVGDYIDYRGVRYELYSIPQPTKQARPNTYGAAFVYSQIQFFAPTKRFEICPFRDIVKADNTIHFTTLPDVATFENLYGIADRIQANLDDMYPGEWSVEVHLPADTQLGANIKEIYDTPMTFSVSNGTILDALNQINSLWKYNNIGIGWVYNYDDASNKNILTIGRPTVQEDGNTTSPFLYGKGNGLKAIKKDISSNNEIATRLFAYGSTRNMPSRYYNTNFPQIKESSSVYLPNLMIPVSKWGKTDGAPDASKSYVENEDGIQMWGVRPKSIYFTGSGEWEEIYPSIEKVTIGDVLAGKEALNDTEYVPKSSVYTNNAERIDEIKGAVNPSDDGFNTKNGKYIIEDGEMAASQEHTERWEVDLTQTTHWEDFAYDGVLFTQTLGIPGELTIENINAVVGTSGNAWTGWDEFSVEFALYLDDKLISPLTATKTPDNQGDMYQIQSSIKCTTEQPGTIRIKVKVRGNIRVEQTYEKEQSPIFCTLKATATKAEFSIYKKLYTGFSLTLKQIGFCITDYHSNLTNGYCTISMKDGMCAGREFLLKAKPTYNEETDDWTLDMVRQYDKTLGQYFPNIDFPISAGDHFVILDIDMPMLYVETASNRLYQRVLELSDYFIKQKNIYSPEIDDIQMQRWANEHNGRTITEGMYFCVEDEDVNDDTIEYMVIDSITIDESQQVPHYSVTLRDEKRIKNTVTQGTGANLLTDGSSSAQYETSESTSTGGGSSSGGTMDHNALVNRNSPGQHSIEAISGLSAQVAKIDAKLGKSETAKSAEKLANSVTIWGQEFDGTKNISGAFTAGLQGGSYNHKLYGKTEIGAPTTSDDALVVKGVSSFGKASFSENVRIGSERANANLDIAGDETLSGKLKLYSSSQYLKGERGSIGVYIDTPAHTFNPFQVAQSVITMGSAEDQVKVMLNGKELSIEGGGGNDYFELGWQGNYLKIVNFKDELLDSSKYQMVMMHYHMTGKWKVPAYCFWDWELADENKRPQQPSCPFAEDETHWDIEADLDRIVHTKGNVYAMTVRSDSGREDSTGSYKSPNGRKRFKTVKHKKQRVGFAIFKKTGESKHGWERVSDIAYREYDAANINVRAYKVCK